MRIAILCPSPYSETSCAVSAHVARLGYVPVGALALPSWDRKTLVRKISQWGLRESLRYARAKLAPGTAKKPERVRNPYLAKYIRHRDGIFQNMHEVARAYGFPVVTCRNQNSAAALDQLRQWAPDVVIFTGGNILRGRVLAIPRLGVMNSHLALLPELRGMNTVEWSLLCGVPLGITIHLMDSGIDTGPILLRQEFRDFRDCLSLTDLQNRMIGAGIELIGEAIAGLDKGTISAIPQADREEDRQFFVMHDALKTEAMRRLKQMKTNAVGGASGG
ncbi:MAG TPA: formyltransferase family protein [Terriglobales bacterium]|nr:formyltransferase family protein [Terriglobales bacterium]